jgi:hypothetical protein
MMIFRYWLTNGRTFDEVSPVQDQPVDVVRDHLAASLCPPVQKPRDSWLIPAFHVTDTKGVAHVVNTANLVEVEVLEIHPGDPAYVDPKPAAWTPVESPEAFAERMAQASRDMRSYTPDQTEPGPGHLRLAASDGAQVQRRSHGGPFGGHTFT